MKKIILFDMDGTLIDSTNAIYESFKKVFEDNNMPILDKKEVTKYIGHPLDNMFSSFGAPSDKIKQYYDEYKTNYSKFCYESTQMLPNAVESIKLCADSAILGIVTTKTSKSAKEILKYFGINQYFTTIIGREDVKYTKPHKEPILNAIKDIESKTKLDLKNADIFMIGDTILDLESAKGANVVGIGVLCGYGIKKDLEKFSNFIFKDTLQAVEFIQKV